MELTININIDNAAFCDIPEVEVSRILEEYAINIALNGTMNRKLYDVNGNNVGQAKVIPQLISEDNIIIPVSLYKDLNRVLNQIRNTNVSGLTHGKCSYDIVSVLEKIGR